MDKIQTYSQKFTLFCAFAACFCFAHSNLMTITMVAWLCAWFIEIILRGKNNNFELPNKNNIPLYLTIGLFLWMVASLLWTENTARALRLLEIRIPMLIFPLFTLFGMKEEKQHFKKLLLAFAVGTIIYSIIVPIQTYYNAEEQMKADPENANMYFVEEFNDIKHRTQLGLLQLLSLCALHYLKPQLVELFKGRTILYHLLFCLCSLIVGVVLYLSEGRSMLGMSLLLIMFLTLKFFWRIKLKFISIAVVPIVFIGGFIIFKNHPRMQDFEFTKEKLERFDPRYTQWECASSCISSDSYNMFLGEGIGDYTDTFSNKYKSMFPYNDKMYSSAHNIWIDGQLEWGLIGNIMLLCIFIFNLLFMKSGRAKFTLYSITIIWLAFTFTEPMFSRSMPINLFCFFIVFSHWIKKEEEVLNETSSEKPVYD